MELTAIAAVFHTLLAFLVAWLAFVAWRHADSAAQHHARLQRELGKLLQLRGEISGNSSALDSLTSQLQKLRGQFHAFKAAIEDSPYPSVVGPAATPQQSLPMAAPYCENYHRAQVDGPLSDAARCECGYCVEMRARREAARRELLPKTAAAQARHAKEAANGQE